MGTPSQPRLAFVVLVLFARAVAADAAETTPARERWPKAVTIGTGAVGGPFGIIAAGYARLISERLGVPANTRVTGGPEHNVQLVQLRQIEIGLTSIGPVLEGLQGVGWAPSKMDAVRAVFPMYTSYAHFMVNADSPIRTVADLNGKVVNLQSRGGTSPFVGTRVLQLFAVRPRKIVHLSFADGAAAMRDKVIDANFVCVGAPVPAWAEAAKTRPTRFFGFSDDQVKLLTGEFPYLSPGGVPSGIYQDQNDRIRTVQMFNATVVHRDVPEDFVYELVKVVLSNKDFLATFHRTALEHVASNISQVRLPLHPGAVRFYRELGTQLAEEQMPAELKEAAPASRGDAR